MSFLRRQVVPLVFSPSCFMVFSFVRRPMVPPAAIFVGREEDSRLSSTWMRTLQAPFVKNIFLFLLKWLRTLEVNF